MASLTTRLFGLVFFALVLSGCATQNRRDPLEPLNRGIYQFNDAFDKALAKPVAQAYDAVVPDPLQMMVRNFFSNLDDVVVTFNDLLQFKFGQALQDGTRVLVNSTVGILGLADIASAIGLDKHDEDFGQTLGRWGIGDGPYLVLPFLGPSSVRDGVGRLVDVKVDPIFRIDHIPTRNQVIAVEFEARRADLLDAEKVVDEAAIDRYSFIRDAYLQRRRSLVHDGNPPRMDEDENNDVPPATGPSSSLAPDAAPASVAAEEAAPAAVEPAPADRAEAPASPAEGPAAVAPDALAVAAAGSNVYEPAPVTAFPDLNGSAPEARAFIVRLWLPQPSSH
ncbi:MAG: VacJ family lipoprotein [Betaproteobacteria bacterium]|nr:VacJ family lipoprotein [Betaproteobacteria bacterium]